MKQQAQQGRKGKMKTVNELLASPNIHPLLKAKLEAERKNFSCLEDCVLVTNEVAVVAHSKSDYSSGGGVGRKSFLSIFYLNQVVTQSWTYADKWSASEDRRDLMILKIGKTEIKENGSDVSVTAECIPPTSYEPRFVTFSFNKENDDRSN